MYYIDVLDKIVAYQISGLVMRPLELRMTLAADHTQCVTHTLSSTLYQYCLNLKYVLTLFVDLL